MTDEHPTLYELARAGHDREAYRALQWEGSFQDYMALVEEQPWLARNAWQRLLDMIEHHGGAAGRTKGAPRRWHIFDDPHGGGRDAVYGLDTPLEALVQTLRAGARGFGPERRVILLHGPVGSAKSTIVRLLKRGLEHYSHTDDGALYTFTWDIDGERIDSPMHQEPLLLVPRETRLSIEKRLNKKLRR